MALSPERALLESIRSIDINAWSRLPAYLEFRHGKVVALMEFALQIEINELHDEIIAVFNDKWNALALSDPSIPIFQHIRNEKARCFG